MDGAISTRFLGNEKQRAAPARATYNTITPISGSNSGLGQTIRFKLPSGRMGAYIDPNASFMELTVKSSDVATLSSAGITALFDSIQVKNASSYISSLQNNTTYREMLVKRQDPDFLVRDGAVIHGTFDNNNGITFSAETPRTLCEFLPNMGGVFAVNRYLPLASVDGLEVEIRVHSQLKKFLTWSGETAMTAHEGNSAPFTITDVRIHLAVVEVSPEVDSMIIEKHDGVFRFLSNSMAYYQATIPSGATRYVWNLGASFSSVNALHLCMTANDAANEWSSTRDNLIKNNITRATLLIDGSPVIYGNAQEVSKSAVNLCFARGSAHALSDPEYFQAMQLSEYDGKGYIISFDLETMTGRTETLRSGLSTISSTMQVVLEFESTPAAVTAHAFLMYDALVSLDVGGSRTWEVSV